MTSIRALLSVALAFLATYSLPVHALDPDRSIVQYKHTRWTTAEGVPAMPRSLVQAKDGHLWMASLKGVFRFDGLAFEQMDTEIDRDRNGAPYSLLGTSSGDIWAWYQQGVFAVYRDGRFQIVPSPKWEGHVIKMFETPDGEIWAARGEFGRPMLRFAHDRWSEFDPTSGMGHRAFLSAVSTSDGGIWLSYVGLVIHRSPGSTGFRRVVERPGALLHLSLDPSGRVWMSGAGVISLLSGPGGRQEQLVGEHYPLDQVPRGGYSIIDRDGSFWVIGMHPKGLLRTRLSQKPQGASRTDYYGESNGLSSNTGSSIVEDREGSIWVATTRGLDRFRSAKVVVEPLLTNPAAYGDRLFAASDGNFFVAQASTVYRIAPGGAPEPYITNTSEPEAVCEAPGSEMWFVFADKIIVVAKDGRRTNVDLPKVENGIYDCAADRWGRLWLTAAGSGLFQRAGNEWVRYAGPPSGPESFFPIAMISAPDRSLWMYWNMHALARMDASGPKEFSVSAYPDLIDMDTFFPGEHGPIVAGSGGIGQVREGKMVLATGPRMSAFRGLNGLAQTPEGDTWGMAADGIVRMKTADLERAYRDPTFAPPVSVLDFHDGLPDSRNLQNWRSIVRGSDGRLWVNTLAGTVWVNPQKLYPNPTPPKVAITALNVDGVTHRDPRRGDLSAGASSLSIRFAALTLATPERVSVRYKLEGYDREWTDPGLRREAFYTNLEPGSYSFRVIAANEDGIWNREGATVAVTIEPTFIQSLWFKLLLTLTVLAIGVIAYQLRLRQMKTRLQSQFNVRTAERERIARELHDTLLQGVHALMLHFQAAANRVTAPDVRDRLDDALDRADKVLIEGRARVRDLRCSSEPAELSQRLLDLAEQQIEGETPRPGIAVCGDLVPLHPLVFAEAVRIAEEAIRNSVRHAEATRLDLQLVYGAKEFSMRISDNGAGIPESVLLTGSREGHFGLIGMRERARQVGGELRIASSPDVGTEITLVVPARSAYAKRNFDPFNLLRKHSRARHHVPFEELA